MKNKLTILVFFCVGALPVFFLFQNMSPSVDPQSAATAQAVGSCPSKIRIDGVGFAADDTKAALYSLQGLMNRRGPCAYLFPNSETSKEGVYLHLAKAAIAKRQSDRTADENLLNFTYANQPEYNPVNYTTLGDASDPAQEAAILKKMIQLAGVTGAFVYDDQRPVTLLAAMNAAGAEALVILTPRLKAFLQSDTSFSSFNFKYDAAKLFPQTEAGALWYAVHYFSKNRFFDNSPKLQLYLTYPIEGAQPTLDLAIQRGLFAFWRPYYSIEKSAERANDEGYSPQLETLIENVLKETLPNAFVYGWVGNVKATPPYGWAERQAVDYLAKYSKLIINTAQGDNFSFHDRFKVQKMPSQLAYTAEIPQYDKNKRYVAFVMQDSGTSPWYFEKWFHRYQWTNASRPTFPMSWAMTPRMADLMPAYSLALYKSATPQNYFLASEGLGYSMLFEGYGSEPLLNRKGQPMTQSNILNLYFGHLNSAMEFMDMKAMCLHSHPSGWDANDEAFLSNEILPRMTPQMSDLLLDMNVNNAVPASGRARLLPGYKSMFRTITRFAVDKSEFTMTDSTPETDALAVDSLYEQIHNYIIRNPDNSQFLEVMSLSWSYGPDRLNQLKDKLSQQYPDTVFLTEYQMGQVLRQGQ